jgi:hypothetical protein
MVQTSFPVQQLAHSHREANAYSRTEAAQSATFARPVHLSPRVTASSRTRGDDSRIRQLDWLLFTLFALGTVALLLRGWQFYTLTVGERVDHPDFRVLGPSTSLGRAYGVAGFCMMLTNLAYLVRRKLARLSLGSLRAWLDIHTFTGLFGGLLVVFHSAFQVRTTIAVITVGSLFVAILTGIIGRSIYSLTPRPDRARLAQHLAVFDRIGPGMGQALTERLALIPRAAGPGGGSLIAVALALPGYLRELRERRRVFDGTVQQYAQLFGHELGQVRRRIADCRSIYSCEVQAAAAEALLRSWRGVHRLSALLMVLLVVMHIAIAWYYGFVWAASH